MAGIFPSNAVDVPVEFVFQEVLRDGVGCRESV
jgi:hypothetical protein